MEATLRFIKKFIPKRLFRTLQPIYHYLLAFFAALIYGFPSDNIKVIAVTGTKGKSTTVELVNAIFEEAGYRTAVAGTIRFKIGEKEERNLYKMTMPGRFTVQKFLKRAVREKCDFVIIEMTSEGAKQFRHKFISQDALIFTNISPEHIESHGSYEKYLEAKLSIARSLSRSKKKRRLFVVNVDDSESSKFINAAKNCHIITYSLNDAHNIELNDNGSHFEFKGEEINSKLPGEFNIYNMLSAATLAKAYDIPPKIIKEALQKISNIKGRVERINAGQNFDVVVDYAHTIDSLQKLYKAFPAKNKICVLGNTGGGRDKWKRSGMAKIAEENCEHIILTNEDPYDEDPLTIVNDMQEAIDNKEKVEVIMDRRAAIQTALLHAFKKDQESQKNTIVLISGKGTDPYIMLSNGKKLPWSDEQVTREELRKIMNHK